MVKTAVFKLVLSTVLFFCVFFFFENFLHLLAFHFSAQYHSYFSGEFLHLVYTTLFPLGASWPQVELYIFLSFSVLNTNPPVISLINVPFCIVSGNLSKKLGFNVVKSSFICLSSVVLWTSTSRDEGLNSARTKLSDL